jgi:uncharacterized alpha-E superfamily protein
MTGESWGPETVGWQSLMKLYECLESPYSRLAKDDPQGHLDQQGDLEKEILSLIFEEQRSDSLNANLSRATRAAAQVRDRLSTDLLRIVSQMGSIARASDRVAWGYVSPADALAVLNSCILTLAALRGIEAGNITRGPGWHFLNIGRRIERSVEIVELLRSIVVPIDPENWPSLEMLLEVADSSITYRSRYFTILQAAPVVDLLMNDEANPRSLAFQLKDLARHCGGLSGMPSGSGWPVLKQRQMEAAAARLLHADVESLCEARTGTNRTRLDSLLGDLAMALPAFAEAISNTYFSHAQTERAT